MKAVILAAGEGMRMRPLTLTKPKPMLEVCGKPLLEHIIRTLPAAADELVIVVGYRGEQIRKYFGDHFGRFRITYVEQKEQAGTYKALELCREFLADGEYFLMLYADDLHGRDGLEACALSETQCIVVAEAEHPECFGVVELNADGTVRRIVEKPEQPATNLVSTGVQLLSADIFKFPARRHIRGEFYLTDSIAQMIEAGYKFTVAHSSFWLPVGYPDDLDFASANLHLL
ncbi:MAG: NTP transferase domain-containing protein [Candidatus Niyogibacteria bacterium]|nr:NTP transferase domain-containing protein [Candidatus Niyogibacteria bacterium]